MRLLLANTAFHATGGSETYLLTLAQNLLRLGHHVTIFATVAGDMAALARRAGVPVVDDVADLGEPADVVLAQDGHVAHLLGAHWPRVPQVFVCHSSLFDFQQPPLVAGHTHAVVVLNDRVRRRVEALATDLRVVRLRQPIDTQRFSPWSAPAPRPRRALLFSNYRDAQLHDGIVAAWEGAGVEIVHAGGEHPSSVPEEVINSVDVVVARGRSALEAMSCARPTYVYDSFGGDGWITPETYAAIEADGITGQAGGARSGAEQLRRDLELYDPAWGRQGREIVLAHHDARQHAAEVVELLREATPVRRRQPSLESELARQVRLRWAVDGELFAVRAAVQRANHERDEMAERLDAARREVADLTLALEEHRESVRGFEEKVARLESEAEHMRERGRTYRRRIKRLRARVAAAEAAASRPWWRRSPTSPRPAPLVTGAWRSSGSSRTSGSARTA